MSEHELLLKRGREFLEESRLALREGRYDVACFLAEQGAQLVLKAYLLRYVGDYPRTHDLRRLAGELLKAKSSNELKKFLKERRISLIALEDAYLASRYFSRSYAKEDAEKLLEVAEELVGVVEREYGG